MVQVTKEMIRDPLQHRELFIAFLQFNLHRVYPTMSRLFKDYLLNFYPCADFGGGLYRLCDGYGYIPKWVRDILRQIPDYITGEDVFLFFTDYERFQELISKPMKWYIDAEGWVWVRRPHWRGCQEIRLDFAPWWVLEKLSQGVDVLHRELQDHHPRIAFADRPYHIHSQFKDREIAALWSKMLRW